MTEVTPRMMEYAISGTTVAKVDILALARTVREWLPRAATMAVAQIVAEQLAQLVRMPVQYGWEGSEQKWEEKPL